jgi:hypothetical protein
VGKKHVRATNQWHKMDLHIHTPASSDYQQTDVSYLDVLQRAEARGLEIMAFCDHNTVAGYRKMQDEIQQLTLLEQLNRLLPEERDRLAEYRRLLGKILVLPGVELTATFGFHIMGVFSPKKPIREIEHLLLNANIPPTQLDDGSATVGATLDVLSVYRLLNQAGGIVIAAHANSSNGVAMRGFTFGGQTKIAYTQDTNLHALEVTDLEQRGPRTTAAFFNGTKPEYPRRMHCIQGSDAHRLVTETGRKKNPGIGDRATDVFLPELSFEALKDLFTSSDFTRTRPHHQKEEPVFDFIQAAIEEGPNIVQDFHESMTIRGGKLYAIIADVCAFGNTNGGTLYIGISGDPKKAPGGVTEPDQCVSQLEKEIASRISPPIHCNLDLPEYKTKKILRVLIPRGEDPPYAVDDNKIYIRNEAETSLAVRDEIVGLVLRGAREKQDHRSNGNQPVDRSEEKKSEPAEPVTIEESGDLSPRTGVEVLPPEDREGSRYYTMRDLRNGNKVKNVTRSSARRLWHYAISRYQEMSGNIDQTVTLWQGDLGLARKYKQGKTTMYDLVQRTPDGFRYFYGVTPDGIHGAWKGFTNEEEA